MIVLVLCISSAHAKPAFYSPDLKLLFIPEVKINGHLYIDGVLNLENNGEYSVNNLTHLEPGQQDLLNKIKSIPCGPADTLGRFSAYLSFINGNSSYCLVKTPSITVEGGRIFSYLFIENGSASVIIDLRDDTYRGCCQHLYSTKIEHIQFGHIQADIFIEQNALADIDFEHDYIIKLTGDGIESQNY